MSLVNTSGAGTDTILIWEVKRRSGKMKKRGGNEKEGEGECMRMRMSLMSVSGTLRNTSLVLGMNMKSEKREKGGRGE